MTFDVKATADIEEVDKVKVIDVDPTILSLEDIMAMDDDIDLGLEEEDVKISQESQESIEKVDMIFVKHLILNRSDPQQVR